MAAGVPPGQRRIDRRHESATAKKSPACSGISPSRLRTRWKRRISGVKGQLAVKIYGEDLKILEEKGAEVVRRHAPDPRSRRPGNASRDRPAEPEPGRGPRRRRPLPDQRRGCAGCHPDRGGRQCRQPGAAGRTALRPGGAISSPLPRHQGSHREHSPAFALRRARLAGAALQDPHGGRRFHALSRGELALRRHQVQRARPRPGQHRGGSHPQGQPSR